MWEIGFYVRSNGRCPVQEFLDGLSKKDDLPFIVKAFERLELYGHNLRRPHVDYLWDDIYELRVKTRNKQARIFYFYFDQEKIILTNGSIKKTREVNKADIDRAIEYRQDYISRIRGKKR